MKQFCSTFQKRERLCLELCHNSALKEAMTRGGTKKRVIFLDKQNGTMGCVTCQYEYGCCWLKILLKGLCQNGTGQPVHWEKAGLERQREKNRVWMTTIVSVRLTTRADDTSGVAKRKKWFYNAVKCCCSALDYSKLRTEAERSDFFIFFIGSLHYTRLIDKATAL